jgi:hypothetical protein
MLINVVARHTALALLLVLLAAGRASAQFDFNGSWAPIGTEDVQNDSLPVDYLGLALTDEGRARALAYDESQKSMIDRQCQGWGAAYAVIGPFGLVASTQTDPATKRVVSYSIESWEDWNGLTIWMDGRPRPSQYALHTQEGFTLGRWEGGALAARTTHMKTGGFIRKTGVPLSDQATLTTRFYRHGDILTVLAIIEDPLHLAEPQMITKNFRHSPQAISPVGPACIAVFEGTTPGESVSHYVPEKNPFVDEMTKKFGVPREAALGAPETLYPEYRKKMKAAARPAP